MKIEIIKSDIKLEQLGIKLGNQYEGVIKKEPDKFNKSVRYLVPIPNIGKVNIAEEFVDEI